MAVAELGPERLRAVCDPECFPYRTTEQVPPLEGMIGQSRAMKAMEFGLKVRNPGYNIYMAGVPGTGKTTYAINLVSEVARQQKPPDDWCYVYNFEDPDRPLALRLPPGKGGELQRDMEELVQDLKAHIPRAFESADYEQQRTELMGKYQSRISEILRGLAERARSHGFALQQTAAGFLVAPLLQGQPISAEQYQQLPEPVRKEIEERGSQVQEWIAEAQRQVRLLEKEARGAVKELEQRIVRVVVGPLIDRLQEKWSAFPLVVNYLTQVEEDVRENLEEFRSSEQEGGQLPFPFPAFRQEREAAALRYRVNLLVNNAGAQGAPVVVEANPTYYNLFGAVEYRSHMGVMVTDFTMIRAGALHRANGGYLILQVRDVLTNPGSWEGLKRALKNRSIQVENMGEQFRLIPTRTLRPEPIPLDVKIILIGNSLLHLLLYYYDEDFRKFFKVKADFDTEMPWTQENLEKYFQFLSSLCRREGIRHLDQSAVAKVVEYSARLAGNQKKLSTRFNEVVEVVYEANVWAEAEGAQLIGAAHIQKAIEEKIYRSNRIEEKIREMITEGKILVDTEGAVVGQVNGLSVLQVGDYSFGRPSRITARTFLGEEGVVNIERETEMSGNIHSKGVLILGGYLGGKYAQDKPLSLSARLCFEQLYEEVEGDSASSTELYALLSSLSGLPIRQDMAVTGSVNQNGELQPIGGVNEKIEGFYAVCKVKGLTGTQGVIIPQQNVDDLMLKEEVVEAVREGKFHIYPVRTVDEGIELLTGVPAGTPGPGGSYPEGTVHYLVDKRLREQAERLASFGERGRGRPPLGRRNRKEAGEEPPPPEEVPPEG